MANFSKLLDTYLKKYGISQSIAAQFATCSRSMIYAVICGEKRLSETKFLCLLSKLPLSASQNEKLQKAYYNELYGDSNCEKLYCINDWLSGKKEKRRAKIDSSKRPIPDSSCDIADKNQLLGYIEDIISDDNCKTIYTNYPFSDNQIDNYIYSSLVERKAKIEFNHIVEFESNNETTININNIFSSLRYMRINHVPYGIYTNRIFDHSSSDLFPYYFVSNCAVLLFNCETYTGLFLVGNEVTDTLIDNAKKICTECKPLGKICNNVLELKNFLSDTSKKNNLLAFGNTACFCTFAKKNIISSIAKPDLSNRNILIDMAILHYKDSWSQHPKRIYSTESFRKFVNDGIVNEFPRTWTSPLPYEQRKYILERCRDEVIRYPQSLFIIDNDTVDFNGDIFDFEIYDEVAMLASNYQNKEDSYIGEIFLTIHNKTIIEDFKNYFDFIERKSYANTQQYAINFFDDLILECERLKNEENSKDKMLCRIFHPDA